MSPCTHHHSLIHSDITFQFIDQGHDLMLVALLSNCQPVPFFIHPGEISRRKQQQQTGKVFRNGEQISKDDVWML